MPGLSLNTQTNIAFKNLLNKSHTDAVKGLGNEAEDIKFNIHSDTVFVSPILSNTATTIAAGNAIFVQADLTLDGSSNGHAFFATWPIAAPTGTDPVTALPYAYGSGLLTGITPGDRVKNAISFVYGTAYEAIPYSGVPIIANRIYVNDPRNWVYQYQSGIFFQENIGTTPQTIEIFAYTGSILTDVISVSFIPLAGTNPGFPVTGDIEVSDGFKFYLDTSPTTHIKFNLGGVGSPAIPTLEIAGNVEIVGDLLVSGTTITLNETELQIQDNLIILNFGGTHTTANLGGIEIVDGQSTGVDSTLLIDTNGQWIFTPGFTVNGLANYDIDRSAFYTLRSLVDKDYVDTVTGASGGTTYSVAASATSPFGSPGVSSYTGLGTPTVIAYTEGEIYITIFDTDNLGPATLEIDGLGSYDILKGDETFGLIALEGGDIQALVAYYLIWDGTQFQIFATSPAAAAGTYTNLNPVPATIGGVAVGTTFNNTTYKQVFDMLFYPYMVPNFSAFSISGQTTTLEVGASIASGSKTFLWSTSNPGSISANTVKLIQTTAPYTILASGLANDGTESIVFGTAITKTSATSHNWQIQATRTNASLMSRNFTVYWYWRTFYGTSLNTILTAPQVQALTNTQLASVFGITATYVAGGYKYYAIPNVFGFPSLFRDFSTNLAVAMAGPGEGYTSTNGNGIYYTTISVTNAFSVVMTYRVYRTRNILGGTIKIIAT